MVSSREPSRLLAAHDEGRTGYAKRLVGVLKLFAEQSDVLSITEVGEMLGLPNSSVHRVLVPLVKLGLVERAERRRYRIGTELYRLALLIPDQFELMKTAKPAMIETARLAGETCLLGLLTPDHSRIVLVHKIDGAGESPCSFELLKNITPAWGSVGRAVMAWVSPPDLLRIVKDAGPAPVTGELLPELRVLQKELQEIRRTGLAHSLGKRGGLHAGGIASPFFDDAGRVRGSIGVIAPSHRLSRAARVRLGPIVRAQAALLSRALGNRAGRVRSSAPLEDGA